MANRYQDPPFSADDADRGHEFARPKGEGDPLAELARLIGQTDPFANFGRANQTPRHDDHQQPEQDADDAPSSPPPWMQRANAHGTARQDAARQDFETLQPAQRYQDEYHEPEAEAAYHQAPAFAAAADHDHQADPDRYDQALFGEVPGQHAQGHEESYQDDAYAYQDGYADDMEQPAPKRRGGMMTVAVVLALAVVGTGAAFGYRTYIGSPRSGEPPVIKADTGPNKVVPPSATADANSKLIQDRLGGAAAPEKLVSREEQPVNVQDATKGGPRVVFPPLNVNNNPPSTASVAPAAKPLAGPPTLQAGDEPRKIRTFAVRGDQDPNATPAAKQLPKQAAAARPAANANANASAPLSLSPQAAAPAAPAAAPARVANNAPTQIAPAPATGNGSGGYLVQIASQRNEAEAQASFRALQGKYPAVLGSRTATIKRADLGEKGTYYRAMVGPFASSEEALSFCTNYKSAGGQCVVPRN